MRGGDICRAVRRGRRLSQRELAELAGIPRSTIERIESGAIASPRIDVIARLLEATGYFLVLVNFRGRPVHVRYEVDELIDRAQRCFPAHQRVIRVVGEGDGWWGWRRIAWLPSDPLVPEYAHWRAKPEWRLPQKQVTDWSDAT